MKRVNQLNNTLASVLDGFREGRQMYFFVIDGDSNYISKIKDVSDMDIIHIKDNVDREDIILVELVDGIRDKNIPYNEEK